MIEWKGRPLNIRTDNGTEFIANSFQEYCNPDNGTNHMRIQKGKPNQKGFVERFNRLHREDILNANIFKDLTQVRQLIQLWMDDYNNNHPHKNLGDRSPVEFMNVFNCGKLIAQNAQSRLPQLTTT